MKPEAKTEAINTLLRMLGILSVFWAGYIFPELFLLALFLFVCGVIVLQMRITYEGEREE